MERRDHLGREPASRRARHQGGYDREGSRAADAGLTRNHCYPAAALRTDRGNCARGGRHDEETDETPPTKRRFRSQAWFDNPDDPGATALYFERYLNYGLTRGEIMGGKPIIGIAQTGSDLSPCNRHHLQLGAAGARRHPCRRRHRLRIPGASDPGNRQAPDRRARPQPRLSRSGRGALRLSDRRRGAHHRLRQDHPRRHHGGGDRQHPGDRAVRRADAQRLVEGRTRRLRHHQMGDVKAARRRRDRLRRIRRLDCGGGALDRPLQHHGHGVDHECAGRSARPVAARLRLDPGALQGARADRL